MGIAVSAFIRFFKGSSGFHTRTVTFLCAASFTTFLRKLFVSLCSGNCCTRIDKSFRNSRMSVSMDCNKDIFWVRTCPASSNRAISYSNSSFKISMSCHMRPCIPERNIRIPTTKRHTRYPRLTVFHHSAITDFFHSTQTEL